MFPFAAEFDLMAVFLPRQVVRNRIAVEIAPLRRVEVVAQREVHRIQVEDFRTVRADAIAVGVATARRGRIPVPPVHMRETEVVHQRAAQDARDPDELLVDIVLVRDEIRRRDGRAERPAVRVAVVRIPREERMLGVEAIVGAAAQLSSRDREPSPGCRMPQRI